MTNPAAAQNQEIDCLSPEAQRLVRRKHVFETFGSDCQCLVLIDVLGARGRRHLPPQSSVPGEVWGCLAWPGTPLNERPHASMGGGGGPALGSVRGSVCTAPPPCALESTFPWATPLSRTERNFVWSPLPAVTAF